MNLFGISFQYFLEGGGICDKEKEKNNEMKEFLIPGIRYIASGSIFPRNLHYLYGKKILFSLHLYALN